MLLYRDNVAAVGHRVPLRPAVGALLPATLLPATLLPATHRRPLAATPLPRATPARETWATTIRDAARFAAGYRWRMAWGVVATGALLAALFWGLGQLYPHVFLTEWAYEAGVLGIKTARWLFGGGV